MEKEFVRKQINKVVKMMGREGESIEASLNLLFGGGFIFNGIDFIC